MVGRSVGSIGKKIVGVQCSWPNLVKWDVRLFRFGAVFQNWKSLERISNRCSANMIVPLAVKRCYDGANSKKQRDNKVTSEVKPMLSEVLRSFEWTWKSGEKKIVSILSRQIGKARKRHNCSFNRHRWIRGRRVTLSHQRIDTSLKTFTLLTEFFSFFIREKSFQAKFFVPWALIIFLSLLDKWKWLSEKGEFFLFIDDTIM